MYRAIICIREPPHLVEFPYLLGIKYGIGMAQMMNQKIPENMTRTALGTAINDFSKTLWHVSEQSPSSSRHIFWYLLVHHLSHTNTIFDSQ
jgi:hypothetical protein